MWSKEHKKLAKRGWSENEIQAHFREREVIEYQRYNPATGKSSSKEREREETIFCASDMQMDSPEPVSAFAER